MKYFPKQTFLPTKKLLNDHLISTQYFLSIFFTLFKVLVDPRQSKTVITQFLFEKRLIVTVEGAQSNLSKTVKL